MKEKDFYKMYLEKIANKGDILQYANHKANGAVGMMVKRLSSNLNIKANILEIGTGSGVLGALLAKKGFKVTAIDNDARMLKLAKSCADVLNTDITLSLMDAFELDIHYGARQFDCSISYGLMEHFSDEEIIRLIKLQKYVAKMVIFCVPSSNISLKYQQKGNGTERYLSMPKWIDLLKTAGAIKTKVFGFGFGKKSKHNYIPEIFGNSYLTSRILAELAGFYEFWI